MYNQTEHSFKAVDRLQDQWQFSCHIWCKDELYTLSYFLSVIYVKAPSKNRLTETVL